MKYSGSSHDGKKLHELVNAAGENVTGGLKKIKNPWFTGAWRIK